MAAARPGLLLLGTSFNLLRWCLFLRLLSFPYYKSDENLFFCQHQGPSIAYGLAPAFGPGHDPGDPGSSPTSAPLGVAGQRGQREVQLPAPPGRSQQVSNCAAAGSAPAGSLGMSVGGCRSFRIYTENPLVEVMALAEEVRVGGGIECPVLLDVSAGVFTDSSRCPAPFRQNYYKQFFSRCSLFLQKYLNGYSLLWKEQGSSGRV
ncbi:unnamed protein product [Nyctereutes procyonoides]|uniref:(raccoon dog) hypothetical protein n=1 Tax=Nyctereutes procyonoides TaxID=34880 RepID=A0A811YSD1_NYCPR|nr:unnamed protein product [Nyctereutes procyonoides]